MLRRTRRRERGPQPRLTARTADRHALYQIAVQAPARDAAFFARWFARCTGKPLRLFREDFCGTAALACCFVALHERNRAIAVDAHEPTLHWARAHNVEKILSPAQQQRLTLVHADVRRVHRPLAQMIAAVNFSYAVFHTRAELGSYLRHCWRSLLPGGLMVLDAWGGGLVHRQLVERRRHRGFDCLWEQRAFDPITHRIDCRIHFEFRDGSRMRDAFLYDWRLWTLPELRELYAEAGFRDVHVLWERTDPRTRAGTGVFRRKAKGDPDPTWLTYVVGQKPARR